MKKTTTVLILLFLTSLTGTIHAQLNLLGTALTGGEHEGGSIYKVDNEGNTELMHSFYRGPQKPLTNSFILGPDSNLIGLTLYGGALNEGTVIEYDLKNDTLYYRNYLTAQNGGRQPFGSLYRASDGNYYGYGSYGGVFRYDTLTHDITQLIYQNIDGGNNPYGTPIEIDSGIFVGITRNNGANGYGTIFKYDVNSGIATTLHNFNNIDGRNAQGGLLKTSSGMLYGHTLSGGTNDQGVLFKINPVTGVYTKLRDFQADTTGSYPVRGTLVEISNGNLMGVTTYGGVNGNGVIFKVDTSSGVLDTVYNFGSNSAGGIRPETMLTSGSGNVVYGVAGSSGLYNGGTLFKYDLDSDTYTVLHDFGNGSDGSSPRSYVYMHPNGKIYGMTYEGGIYNKGVIFEYDEGLGVYTKLHDFVGAKDGDSPATSMINAPNNLIYGATTSGGSYDVGVFYKFDPTTKEYTSLKDFTHTYDDKFGSSCSGRLIQNDTGLIYGVCRAGGANLRGTIFSFDYQTETFTKLYDLADAEGGYSYAGLSWNADSTLLYGVTNDGGLYSEGVIFSFNPVGNIYTKLHDFQYATDGRGSESHLFLAGDSVFYGITRLGGANGQGTIYSFNPSDNTFSVLHDFDNTGEEAAYSAQSFVEGKNGNLYAVSAGGGYSDRGAIFKYNYNTDTFETLFKVGNAGPYNPKGNLLISFDKNYLFGTFNDDYEATDGMVFKYDLKNDSLIGLHSFDGTIGGNSRSGLIELSCDDPAPTFASVQSDTAVCEGENVTLNTSGVGYNSYQWYKDGLSVSGNDSAITLNMVQLSDSGEYKLELWNICGMQDTITALSVNENPTIYAGEDTVICTGSSITLSATGGTSYIWDNGVQDGVAFTPDSSRLYTVESENAAGCTGHDDVLVEVGINPIITEASGVFTAGPYEGYQWYKDGQPITGATGVNYTATESGTYSVEVFNGNCYEFSNEIEYIIGAVTKNVRDKALVVYPNPSSGTVYLKNESTSGGEIHIINQVGQDVYTGKLDENGTINLNLEQGIYLIRMSQEGLFETQKLIISK